MDNPFCGIADPKQLRAMVQDGAECKDCENTLVHRRVCLPCNGTGHTPLPNADLDALAACWCEGWQATANTTPFGGELWIPPDKPYDGMKLVPAYTTSPAAAMRLQVKYAIPVSWIGIGEPLDISIGGLCHYLTTCALIEALTEAIEK